MLLAFCRCSSLREEPASSLRCALDGPARAPGVVRIGHVLVDTKRSGGAAADLLDLGMRHGDRRFAERASAFVAALPAQEREKAVAIAAGLLVHAADVGWETLWTAFHKDPTFGGDVVSLAATRVHRDVETMASRLSPAQLADLYVWTERQFPHSEDPKRSSALMSARDSVAWFRDALLRRLQNSGAPETLAAIEQIARVLPNLPWLAFTRVLAKRAVLRQTWLPPAPDAVLRLTTNREDRLVESGEQLLDVIIDSLRRLETAFQGETPEARAVWDDRGDEGFFPNDENAFSDHVKRHLDRDLRERGIVLNREVEIRRSVGTGTGERTDIYVDAVRRSKSDGYDLVR